MQYEIKRESRFKQTQNKFRSMLEDNLLTVALFLARILHSDKLNEWIADYTQKKIQKMQQQLIRMRWDKITLEKATAAINEKQT